MNNFNINGKVTLDLNTYEKIKKKISFLERKSDNMQRRIDTVTDGASDLADFLNHLSKTIKNFDDLVGAFNSSSETCEIQKDSNNKYRIKLLKDAGKEDNS